MHYANHIVVVRDALIKGIIGAVGMGVVATCRVLITILVAIWHCIDITPFHHLLFSSLLLFIKQVKVVVIIKRMGNIL